ncbi:MAG: hypothetical protein OER04_10525 [Cyclobacteriaceae bacterium]|nr:hypothetical protein [Cyclobacteriaceae bacterium]
MKKILLLIFTTVIFLQAHGQREFDPENENRFFDRVYFGGNFGLQFGDFTVIDISPLAGYMLTPRLSVGPGITYQYLKGEAIDLFTGRLYEYDTNIFGWRVFGRYNITQQFFAYTEYESLKLDYPSLDGTELVRDWVPGYFIGGGFFQPVGGRAGLGLTLLLNLLHDDRQSPYNSELIIRAGITL